MTRHQRAILAAQAFTGFASPRPPKPPTMRQILRAESRWREYQLLCRLAQTWTGFPWPPEPYHSGWV
jgi:hypothetical protein